MEFTFLPRLREVTARIRAGESLGLDELVALKAENRRHAEEAEREDRGLCDAMPTWVNTTNSTVCNLRCGFCPQAYGKGVDWKMTEPIYQKVVEELYPAAETVQLSAYGEPMMTPKLYDRIADMERYGVQLEMVSNFTLMKGDKLVERMARVMGLVTVSIDGATAETYNRLRVGGDFDQVLANVRRYMHFVERRPDGRRPPLHFNFILMRSTVDELSAFLRLAKEHGGEHVTVSHMVLMEEDFLHEMLDRDDDSKQRANDAIEAARDVASELSLSVNLPPPFVLSHAQAPAGEPVAEAPSTEAPSTGAHVLRTPDEPMRCWFLWQRMYVGTTGDVVPCCLAGIHANGNVADSSFFDEWNSPLYQTMRTRVHSDDPYGPCKTCYLVNRSSDTGDFQPASQS